MCPPRWRTNCSIQSNEVVHEGCTPAADILQILYYEKKPTFTSLLYVVTLNLCNAVNACVKNKHLKR